jgi:hypothetical protein
VIDFDTEEQARSALLSLIPEGGPPVLSRTVLEVEIQV